MWWIILIGIIVAVICFVIASEAYDDEGWLIGGSLTTVLVVVLLIIKFVGWIKSECVTDKVTIEKYAPAQIDFIDIDNSDYTEVIVDGKVYKLVFEWNKKITHISNVTVVNGITNLVMSNIVSEPALSISIDDTGLTKLNRRSATVSGSNGVEVKETSGEWWNEVK